MLPVAFLAGVQAIHTFQSGLADGFLSPALCPGGQLLHVHLCVPGVHEPAVPCLGSHEEVRAPISSVAPTGTEQDGACS